MDKRKVIAAYRQGFITIHECAQILGIDSTQIVGIVEEPEAVEPLHLLRKQPVNG